jgi:hypothetical protein
MSKQRIARALIALLMASLTGGIAHAEDATSTILATVATLDGVRFLNPVPAVVMADINGISLGGELAVTVAEIAKLGSDFSVSAKLAGPFDSTLTATDIPASALSMSTATVVDISSGSLGGGTVGFKQFGTLDQTRQIYKVTGQDANTAYSGLYLSTNALTLTIPEGTRGGAYVATVTITLQNF